MEFTTMPFKLKYTLTHIFFSLSLSIVNAQFTYQTLNIEYDSGWTFKNLTLIPIRFKGEGVPNEFKGKNIITLEEGLKQGKLKVKEFYFENDATIRILKVDNKSNDYVWVKDGEMLSGGKQDRIIAESKIINPKESDQFLDVFCIEQYRWSKHAKLFKYAGNADESLKKIMDVSNQQQLIWNDIDSRYATNKDQEGSGSFLNIKKDSILTDTAYLHFFNNKLQKSDSMYAGFMAFTDTAIIGCEVFASNSLTLMCFNSMLEGWAKIAITKGKKPNMPLKKLEKYTDQLFWDEDRQQKFLSKHGKAFIFGKKVFHIVAHN